MNGRPLDRPSIDVRLAAASLPPLPRTAWAEIDLDALAANLATLRGLAGPGVRVEPVVKADAYGHGAVPVARALEAAGADGFCVATYDEALELREGGVRAPVLVLYPVPAVWAPDAARRRIALTAGDPVLLDALVAAIRDAPVRPRRRLAVHLEVETGLGRGGFDPAGLVRAGLLAGVSPGLRVAGLWTHIQAAADATRTSAQLERFEAATGRLRAAGVGIPGRHVAASAGLIAGTVAAYDAVRPGLSIYGLVPDELVPDRVPDPVAHGLRPILSLRARPVRVADLPAGWGISYGPSFVTGRPTRIATLPIGYADGWSRSLSNVAEALVRGRRAPIVGTVAMDAIMVDVTDVPGAPVSVDDEFVLFGEQGGERITVHDLARRRTTISWEIVTAMARRLPRVYHAAAGTIGLRTLLSRGESWPESSSGTATSASSRSTRS